MKNESSSTYSILDADLETLRGIGREQGFPSRLRKKIWPMLLGLDSHSSDNKTETLEPHREEDQVLLDTKRSLTTCLPDHILPESIPGLRDDLQYVITQVLRRHRWLNYYQGYHDIAQLSLLTLGKFNAVYFLERLSSLYLRDFMLSTLGPSMSMLRVVHQIIQIADPEYYTMLDQIEPFYAIPGVLTWWTHASLSYTEACRLFDFFLSSEPVMILYTIAAVTMIRKPEVLKLEGDPDLIFHTLNRGIDGLDIDKVLVLATELYQSIKPRQTRYWRSISSHSCLKTFSNKSVDFEKNAKRHFEAQELELKKEAERKTQHNTDPRTMGMWALGVGILAVGIAWYVHQK